MVEDAFQILNYRENDIKSIKENDWKEIVVRDLSTNGYKWHFGKEAYMFCFPLSNHSGTGPESLFPVRNLNRTNTKRKKKEKKLSQSIITLY